jgi:hypothetical protein
MPDWFTHTLIGWITGKVTKIDIALIVIGSLIPDLVKINIAFALLRVDHYYFFEPIHTPIGAFLIGGIISLFFKDYKKVLFALSIGIFTHFIFDFLLVHVAGGTKILYPLSWKEWQIYLIRSDEYFMTIIAIIISIIIFFLYYYFDKQKSNQKDI